MKNVVAVGVVLASIAVYLISRGADSTSRPARNGSTANHRSEPRTARNRSATIPVAKIIRDAARHVPGDSRDPTAAMIIPPEFRSPPLQDGEMRMTSAPDVPAVIEGAIRSYDLMSYSGLLEWFNQNSGDVSPQIRACKDELLVRGAVLDRAYDWMFALRVVGDGHEARVAAVLASPDPPAVFDEESRACFLGVFARLRWPAKQVVDVTFEWGLRIVPPDSTTR